MYSRNGGQRRHKQRCPLCLNVTWEPSALATYFAPVDTARGWWREIDEVSPDRYVRSITKFRGPPLDEASPHMVGCFEVLETTNPPVQIFCIEERSDLLRDVRLDEGISGRVPIFDLHLAKVLVLTVCDDWQGLHFQPMRHNFHPSRVTTNLAKFIRAWVTIHAHERMLRCRFAHPERMPCVEVFVQARTHGLVLARCIREPLHETPVLVLDDAVGAQHRAERANRIRATRHRVFLARAFRLDVPCGTCHRQVHVLEHRGPIIADRSNGTVIPRTPNFVFVNPTHERVDVAILRREA